MYLVTWLEKNLVFEPGGKIKRDDLYWRLKEECLFVGEEPIKSMILSRTTLTYFKKEEVESKSLMSKGVRNTYYTNLAYRTIGIENPVTLTEIPDILKAVPSIEAWVTKSNSSLVTINMPTGISINGIVTMFSLSFQTGNTWCLYFGEVLVDLEELEINSTYSSREDVLAILNIVNKIKVCKGKEKPDRVAIRSNLVERVTEFGKDDTKSVRTLKCKRVIRFSQDSKTFTCSVCQDIKIVKPLRESDFVDLTDSDAKDVEDIMKSVLDQATDEQREFMLEQLKLLKAKGPNGYRWSKQTIQLSLVLWTRNPRAYEDLRSSGFIRLPSKRILRLYKNEVPPEVGLNTKTLEWMLLEAKRQGVPPHGMHGGIIFDEMSIQEDIQTVREGKCLKLVGFVDCGYEADNLRIIKDDKREKKMANHVLQFQFLGFSGFRFPFAHYPTRQATCTELFILFWDAVSMLRSFGFITDYTSIDGAITNRQFLNMHFKDVADAKSKNFRATSVVNPTKGVYIIMDIKHTLKKIRNNILSSDEKEGTRLLRFDKFEIKWEQWKEAYNWDLKNPVQIHQKLTNEHIYLDGPLKMRNHLAEETLNGNMLQLMMEYQQSLGADGDKLGGCIEFLKQTSILVDIFNDTRPILNRNDMRIQKVVNVRRWFSKWEKQVLESTGIKKKREALMSHETRDDLDSSLLGFIALCEDRFKSPDSSHSVNPARINSDSIENIFCQQRGLHNGNNANPTYNQYKYSMNSIILGQSTLSKSNSRKSNSWKRAAEPISFSTPNPLVPKKRPLMDITNISQVEKQTKKAPRTTDKLFQ